MTSPKFKLRNYPFFWVLLSWGAAPKSLYLQKFYVLKGSSFCDRRRLNFPAFCIYIFLMAWTWKHRIVLRCFATPPSRNIWHLKIWLGFTNYRETSKCDHDWYTTGPNTRTSPKIPKRLFSQSLLVETSHELPPPLGDSNHFWREKFYNFPLIQALKCDRS